MCGKRLSRTWLVLLLLSLPLWATYSDADASCPDILDECMTRLEIATNERESLRSLAIEQRSWIESAMQREIRQQSFSNELMTSLNERDERLKTIELSLSDIATAANRDRRSAYVTGGLVGVILGLVTALLF